MTDVNQTQEQKDARIKNMKLEIAIAIEQNASPDRLADLKGQLKSIEEGAVS